MAEANRHTVKVRVAIGSDHAGLPLKQHLLQWLVDAGHDVVDVGTDSDARVDYPTFAFQVANQVASSAVDRGVVVCGTGQGVCIATNRVRGARGVIIRNTEDALITRQHNDANVACFGARVTDPQVATDALAVFLGTEFEGGRHTPRIEQLDAGG